MGTAILDSEVGAGEVRPIIQIEIPTSGHIPAKISDLELGNFVPFHYHIKPFLSASTSETTMRA